MLPKPAQRGLARAIAAAASGFEVTSEGDAVGGLLGRIAGAAGVSGDVVELVIDLASAAWPGRDPAFVFARRKPTVQSSDVRRELLAMSADTDAALERIAALHAEFEAKAAADAPAATADVSKHIREAAPIIDNLRQALAAANGLDLTHAEAAVRLRMDYKLALRLRDSVTHLLRLQAIGDAAVAAGGRQRG